MFREPGASVSHGGSRWVFAYLSSGCVHGWMMPFMSKYRLSNSTSLGFGLVVSTGIRTPLHSLPCRRRRGRRVFTVASPSSRVSLVASIGSSQFCLHSGRTSLTSAGTLFKNPRTGRTRGGGGSGSLTQNRPRCHPDSTTTSTAARFHQSRQLVPAGLFASETC